MVDESKLACLTYDENGNLSYAVDDESNIECTDSGLAYTGIVRPRLVFDQTQPELNCTPRTDCDCGPIVRDVAGDIWIPPVACYDTAVVLDVSGNANTTLPSGGVWTSPIETHTTDAFNDCDNVCAIYNAYYRVTMTDPPQVDDWTIDVNGLGTVLNCWEGLSSGNAANGPDVFIASGQFSEAFEVLPGGSATFDFFFSINTSSDNDSAFGVFGYEIRIVRHLFRNFDQCETQPLGGSFLE